MNNSNMTKVWRTTYRWEMDAKSMRKPLQFKVWMWYLQQSIQKETIGLKNRDDSSGKLLGTTCRPLWRLLEWWKIKEPKDVQRGTNVELSDHCEDCKKSFNTSGLLRSMYKFHILLKIKTFPNTFWKLNNF